MSARIRSEIWNHFEKTESDPKKAKCKICRTLLCFSGGSTTNLRRHLNTKHPTALLTQVRREDPDQETATTSSGATGSDSAPLTASSTAGSSAASAAQRQGTRPKQTTIGSFLRRPIGPVRQNEVDEQLAKMIARDFQPFSIVEDQGFRDYTKVLDPTYILPSRKTIARTVLPRMYKKLKEELKTKVGSASAVCLTTDCWTSITTESYMAVTCHFIGNDYTLSTALLDCFSFSERHTADNLAEQLKKISEDWSISEKVVACVSDNASNIKAAIQNVGWKHLPCFAHTLNLVVKEGLRRSNQWLTKSSTLWSTFIEALLQMKNEKQHSSSWALLS